MLRLKLKAVSYTHLDVYKRQALCLEKQRADFEKYGVFAPGLIDGLVAGLKKFDDKTLRQDLGNDEAKIMELVQKYFYCG